MGIHDKKLLLMKAVIGIEKRGWNAFHKYHYVLENDINETVRTELVRLKMSLDVSVESIAYETVKDVSQTKTGIVETECSVAHAKMRITLTDVESKESIVSYFYGAGSDKGDKGLYKAYTGGMKYYWLKTLLIPTEVDDPESDESLDKRRNMAVADVIGKPTPPMKSVHKIVPETIPPETMYKFKFDYTPDDVNAWIFMLIMKNHSELVAFSKETGLPIPDRDDKIAVRKWIKNAPTDLIDDILGATSYNKGDASTLSEL